MLFKTYLRVVVFFFFFFFCQVLVRYLGGRLADTQGRTQALRKQLVCIFLQKHGVLGIRLTALAELQGAGPQLVPNLPQCR